MTDWYLKGTEFANCNCAYGCGCQFNALPTHGDCCAVAAFHVEEGRFGGVLLDGVRAAGIYSWPGPVHEGNGRMQLIVDKEANDAQCAAMLDIMSGRHTRDMGTMWWVYNAMSPHKLPSLRAPISFDVDVDARRAEVRIEGIAEMHGEPIRNPVTGAEHRARIDLPNGFEYELAEIGSGTSRTTSDIQLDLRATYGQFARIHLNQNGVVRERARAAAASPA